ncbi:keratin-associated protein 5-9-like [Gordionus sp. m RMFG-2023]|uniref:keratin-associated protein 5-9-like n=1 Tax=Gordionus sp. m RMFG-2023 TaxID=3053472 RepID=UPI0031FD9178
MQSQQGVSQTSEGKIPLCGNTNCQCIKCECSKECCKCGKSDTKGEKGQKCCNESCHCCDKGCCNCCKKCCAEKGCTPGKECLKGPGCDCSCKMQKKCFMKTWTQTLN